ncbi:MAG: hypothetical protein FWC57_02670, partial [Endomicrobia bacterium]|nr:hypothetical protein [Endomicrobiia bacterium]
MRYGKKMENDAQETSTDINTVAGIFSVMRSAVGGNILGMAAIVVFYAAAFTAVNFVLGYPADRTAAVARTLVNLALTMSLVSVLRPAFERGKLKSAAIFPGFMFIIKMVFFIAFLTVVWFLLRLILYGFWSVAGYMILPVATQMFTRDNMYMIVAAAVFVNFAVTTYLAFCFI